MTTTSASTLKSPFPIFTDIDGDPLNAGYLYIGAAGSDAQSNPITVYWNQELTSVATQPVRTISGYLSRAGTPGCLFIDSDYSIKVLNKNGSVIFSSLYGNNQVGNAAISSILSSKVLNTRTGTTTERTQASKNDDVASVLDYGAKLTGTDDDTAALQAALNACKEVVIPAGKTLRITSTVTIPSNTMLRFLGSVGNSNSVLPASYIIKASTMTTVGLYLETCASIEGGGLKGETSNTGDGVQLGGQSSFLKDFCVVGAGGNGVRVGKSQGVNCYHLHNVRAYNNGGHGIYVHDEYLAVDYGANCNVGSLIDCIANHNSGTGIKIGHAYFTTIINSLTYANSGYGLWLSGESDLKNVEHPYPQCRHATVIGGDYKEGNTLGDIKDDGYFTTFFGIPASHLPTHTGTGLQGSGLRNSFCEEARVYGLDVNTYGGNYPVVLHQTGFGGYDQLIFKNTSTNTANEHSGMCFKVDVDAGTTDTENYLTAAKIHIAASNPRDSYGLIFYGLESRAEAKMLEMNFETPKVIPGDDDKFYLGNSSYKWKDIYTVDVHSTNAVTVTSDRRVKEQIRNLSLLEKNVARKLKKLLIAFKLKNDVVHEKDKAKIHIGVIAQDVQDAFASEGLDCRDYNLVSVDDGQLGVRYTELLCFIIAAL
ncbi:Pectate lyase superfamily protein [uncultured Caudovirales phage]|uniref:Pectate lyase superfamily protein n=1 Tax=uncultured Caudovirales phage TaxID=2100421 RepID=A0A6J5L0X7_9CAUD|nr:Pectate lyase superfamily protein [uncultured Caudovirales phage]